MRIFLRYLLSSLSDCIRQTTGYCIICGDFNSRCGNLSDYIDSFNDPDDIDCMNYNTDHLKMVLLMNMEEN